MYNLSGIQKGIQAGHAALEYALKTAPCNLHRGLSEDLVEFVTDHKTFILLDGGGSADMLEREKELEAFGIPFASFLEPDLNNSVSAIAFLVNEEYYKPELEPELTEFGAYLKSFRLASN